LHSRNFEFQIVSYSISEAAFNLKQVSLMN
jgi:hypothetical protein